LGPAVVKGDGTPEQAIDALSADGKLIRRPFLIQSARLVVLVGLCFDSSLACPKVLVKLPAGTHQLIQPLECKGIDPGCG